MEMNFPKSLFLRLLNFEKLPRVYPIILAEQEIIRTVRTGVRRTYGTAEMEFAEYNGMADFKNVTRLVTQIAENVARLVLGNPFRQGYNIRTKEKFYLVGREDSTYQVVVIPAKINYDNGILIR